MMISISILYGSKLYAQTYTISTGGSVSTCSGTFYDQGGSGNYSNGQTNIMTFCPSTAGQVIQVTFTSFSTEVDFDYLYIYDGNSTSAPLLGQFSGTPTLGTIKATTNNATGCLTFKFTSDGATVAAGWVATIACTASPASPMYLISTGGTISACSGTFYDAGGINGNYQKSLNQTITFCPSTAGQVMQVTFSSFNTESGFDYLYVYDGNSTGATLIGTYSGTGSPGTINVTGSNSSGCLTFRFTSDGNTQAAGWVATIACVAPPPPVVSMANGSYTVCSATFYDSGGSGSNYTDNETRTLVFCPSTAGQCIKTIFSSFDLEDNFDYLSVYDGNSTSAPMLVGSSFSPSSPGTLTGTTINSTGCMTFKFYSDGATNASGWAATISCATCVTPPAVGVQQDCTGAPTICGNQSVPGTSLGAGNYNDVNLGLGNLGCLNNYAATPNGSAEHQSNWYFFSPSAGGTIGLTIAPSSATTDFDWAIYGPYAGAIPCPPSGLPLRCSAATAGNSAGGNTGLGNGAVDTEEGTGGNGWVSSLTVTAGQKYILFLDNWNATSAPYTLSWQLSNGAALGCALLPIELISFTGSTKKDYHLIEWITNSENNNDYFTLERSIDGVNWKEITKIKAVRNSSKNTFYKFEDYTFVGNEINYYRLKQIDLNEEFQYSPIITIEANEGLKTYINNLHPNPTSELINFDLYTATPGKVEIQIIDYTGNQVLNELKEITSGKNDLNVNMSELKIGIYLLKITPNGSEKTIIQKIIKR